MRSLFSKAFTASFVIVLVACSSLGQMPAFTWEYVYPQPTDAWLYSVASGPPGIVAVGSGNEVLFSTNALHWERIQAPWRGLNATCFGNDKFLAVGNEGKILWSTNGTNWILANSGVNETLGLCTAGDGKFVAVSWHGTLLVSSNAMDWETRQAPATFRSITFGNNQWAAVAGYGAIYKSLDLINWIEEWVEPINPFLVLNSICFGNGLFVVTGAWHADMPHSYSGSVVAYSNGSGEWNWAHFQGEHPSGEIQRCFFSAGQFVALRAGAVMRSADGIVWEELNTLIDRGRLNGVCRSEPLGWVAVGDMGKIFTSEDAKTWIDRTPEPREYIHNIKHAVGRFVAVGGTPYDLGGPAGTAAVFSSLDGYRWHASLTNQEHQLSTVTFGNGLWVVTGEYGRIFTSRDATNWTDHSLNTSHRLLSSAFGNGRFIALPWERDYVYFSSYGNIWTRREASGLSQALCVRFLNNRFIAVGANGSVFVSTYGLQWQAIHTPTNVELTTVTYGKGRYIAGGRNRVLYSADALNWQVAPVPFELGDLSYKNGWFFATGYAKKASSGMYASRDGISWTEISSFELSGYRIQQWAWGSDLIVGVNSMQIFRGVLTDPQESAPRLNLLTSNQLEYRGAKGFEYRIEQSSNLLSWVPISGWTPGNDNFLLWNRGLQTNNSCFWRAARRAK